MNFFKANGKLKLDGTRLCNSKGKPIQLKGPSTLGLVWYPEYINKKAFKTVKDWGANLIRLAMYTMEEDGYLSGGDQTFTKELIDRGVKYATELGMYVIIDWHILSDGNPQTHKEEAKAFFEEMTDKYKGYDNVLYEICNEPNGDEVTWPVVKAYAEEIIPIIRRNCPDSIILVGTPKWSQLVDEAADLPLEDCGPVMYSVHYYAATHKQELRDRVEYALSKGVPVFLDEYSICDASGDGEINVEEAYAWEKLADDHMLSYAQWNLSNRDESSAMVKATCTKTSDWEDEDLTVTGRWMKRRLGGMKQEDTEENAGKKSKIGIFNIRTKIFLCFILPIICMIVVGIVSYEQAYKGMKEKFLDSSTQTVNMAVEYLDLISNNIVTEANRYTFDENIKLYILGMPGKSEVEKASYYNDERKVFLSTQTFNKNISNIHLMTSGGVPMISTATANKIGGVFEDYTASFAEEYGEDVKSYPQWVTSHTILDEALGVKTKDYFLAFQALDPRKKAYVIVDVKADAMLSVLKDMDFGSGSYVGLLMPDGKELSMKCGEEKPLADAVFNANDFYQVARDSQELSGNNTVSYDGKSYLFLHQKSELNGIMLCALIPAKTVTSQAEAIKTVTLWVVIAATILSLVVGSYIAAGIQGNMKRISKKLDEVAKGNLSVAVKAKGHDEFQSLAYSATNMISNNKSLIMNLSRTADGLQISADNVGLASEDINNCSTEITQAIDEINTGVEKQSEHALECVGITNDLSEKIQRINADVDLIKQAIDKAQEMVKQGVEIVNVLSGRADETATMTSKVGETISQLEAETKSISEFVQTINSISEQTNMLSLNASIEAARAGEAGRGFAVVAEEIRNLADHSSKATIEIEDKIKSINQKTDESAASAREAEKMVELQHEAVSEVIDVFQNIYKDMNSLVEALNNIYISTAAAEEQRCRTVDAVDNISAIIEQTLASSSLVRTMAQNLMLSVDKLSGTASSLEENMNGLEEEIAEFTID